MPPPRRAQRRFSAAYSRGWLSRKCSCSLRVGDGTTLPDDALSAVFARFTDAADVVRCAATCRRWARIVAKDAPAALSRARRQLPRLALGFFHQDDAAATARKRKRSGAMARPCFVPITNSATLLLGFRRRPSFSALSEAVPLLSSLLEHSRPVASRNGRIVLELRREGHADDGLNLCVCNPMTGDVAMIPPLSGRDKPAFYACTLLTSHDLDDRSTPPSSISFSSFFRVLIVYNRPSFTALRSYSQGTGRWSPQVQRSGPRITTTRMQQLRHAVVLRGVAYWTLRNTVFAVRFDTPEPVELAPMPDDLIDMPPNNRVLGTTPDGKLMYIQMTTCKIGPREFYVYMGLEILHAAGEDDDSMSRGTWELHYDMAMRIQQLEVKDMCDINVRWFGERSGIIFFTFGQESSSPGTFTLNLAMKEVNKVSKTHSWSNFCGYEMDGAAFLASILR